MIFTSAFAPCFFSLMAWIIYLRVNNKAKSVYHQLITGFIIGLMNAFLYPLLISPGFNNLSFNLAFFINSFFITLITMMINGMVYYLWKGIRYEGN
ncbi:hypothetical protein COO59_06460 [Mixta theicola]|uniref:Uncharacterized protein n=1 Tax=Mixta theicola TaxID=1458355 RepID=A0A2K1QCI4_9GAMM|nr:hypothetical protein COO59_06460 [Mixta theicola]